MNTQIPMIKSKAFNQIRKILKPNGRKGSESTLSMKEQYDLITSIINEVSSEIRTYKIDRKDKKKISQLRKERGYQPKKKTSKEDYLKMLKTV